jgi:hypothetical protein
MEPPGWQAGALVVVGVFIACFGYEQIGEPNLN